MIPGVCKLYPRPSALPFPIRGALLLSMIKKRGEWQNQNWKPGSLGARPVQRARHGLGVKRPLFSSPDSATKLVLSRKQVTPHLFSARDLCLAFLSLCLPSTCHYGTLLSTGNGRHWHWHCPRNESFHFSLCVGDFSKPPTTGLAVVVGLTAGS